MVVRISDKTQNYSKVTKLLVKPLLNISEEQMGYITNAPTGSGLIKYGGSIVPFVNKMPKGLLYDLNTTKPGDRKLLLN